jgi:hypothetical protein
VACTISLKSYLNASLSLKPPNLLMTYVELNVPHASKLVSVCHIDLWTLKIHFWPSKFVKWYT